MNNAARIAQIQAKLGARTDSADNARPGYKRNVAALRQELNRLQMEDAETAAQAAKADPNELVGGKPVDTAPGQGVASA